MFPEQVPAEYVEKEEPRKPETTARPEARRQRIAYLDGIRGLAALAVAVTHAFQMFGFSMEPVGIISDGLLTGRGIDRLIPPLFNNVIQFGAFAVEIFIVISGYSLMLGVARSKDGRVKGGIGAYFKRRIRRIWPPYYAALAASLLIILLVPGMNTRSNMYWDLALPVTPGAVISHIFFVHYLVPEWFSAINPPMWTVALEEHIYILFPFVLLPLWHRVGAWRLAVIGTAASIILWYLLSPWITGANIWYVGLFCMGAAAASIGFSARDQAAAWRNRLPWGKIGLGLLVGFYLFYQYKLRVNNPLDQFPWLDDILIGSGTACLLLYLTEKWKRAGEEPAAASRALAFLESPPVVWLGIFSYSLYLLHAPILAMCALVIRDAGYTSIDAYLLIVLVGVPAAVVGSYLFHRVFERPFMPVHATQTPAFGLFRREKPYSEAGKLPEM